MKSKIIIGISILLVGVAVAIFLGTSFFSTYGCINKYYLEQYGIRNYDNTEIFCEIMWERGKFFFFVWLLRYVPIKKIIRKVIFYLIGFAVGVMVGAFWLVLGMKGIGLAVLIFFPQGILYLICIGLILGKGEELRYKLIVNDKNRLFLVVFVVFTIISGCLLETAIYVNIIKSILI